MDKIVIWGTGKLAFGHQLFIDLRQVLFFVDNNPSKENTEFLGRKVKLPEAILKEEFDYLVIFATIPYDEIYQMAVDELFVPREKIIFWSEFYGYHNPMEAFQFVVEDCALKGYDTVLDYNLAWRACLNNESKINIYGYEEQATELYPICKNMYTKIIKSFEDLPGQKENTAIFLDNPTDADSILSGLLEFSSKIYISIEYRDREGYRKIKEWCENKAVSFCVVNRNIKRILCINAIPTKTTNIYIACHKEFSVPNVPNYIPLWLGDSQNNIWGYQEDKEAPSISHLNAKINECTGLYWMWKHAKSEYIGLVHYRRYFVNNLEDKSLLTCEEIAEILNKYDIITAPKIYEIITLQEQLELTVEPEAFQSGMELIRQIILKRQPAYAEAFEAVMDGNVMFPCNMMITSKEIFDRYCSWLFSIIVEATEGIDVSAYDDYSKRIIGFIAERLFTVWLLKQQLRIKEMPIWLTEDVSSSHLDISKRQIKKA